MAVTACVLGCLGVVGATGLLLAPVTALIAVPCAILAVVIGWFEQREIRSNFDQLRGWELAILGIVLGALVLVAVAAVWAVQIARTLGTH